MVRLWLLILLVLLWPFACCIFFFPKRIFHLEFGLSVSLVHFCGQESSDFCCSNESRALCGVAAWHASRYSRAREWNEVLVLDKTVTG